MPVIPELRDFYSPLRVVKYNHSWKYPEVYHYQRDHELVRTDKLKPWTPPPEPYDDESYRAWGSKHFGQDWITKREEMINGRDMHAFRDDVSSDYLFLIRQAALRRLEADRELNHQDLDESKTWDQLLEWARWLYGEDFLDQMAVLWRDTRSTDTRVVRRAKRLAHLVREAMWDRHEDLLANGYTWEQLTEWPRRRQGRIQGLTNAVDFASITVPPLEDFDDDGKIFKDNPRTPTDLRRMAVDGPQHNHFRRYEVQYVQTLYTTDELFNEYKSSRSSYVAAVRHERSKREEAEAQARNTHAWFKIDLLRMNWGDAVFERQHGARLAEQESLHHQNMAALQAMVLSTKKPRMFKEFRHIFDRWEVCGITVEEGNYLQENLYGLRNERLHPLRYVDPVGRRFPPWLGQPRVLEREWPKDEADMARLFRLWDGKINQEQQNTLAKMYGLEGRPESDDCEAERGGEGGKGEKDEGGAKRGQNEEEGGGRDERAERLVAGGDCRREEKRKEKRVRFRLRSSRRLAGHEPESGSIE